MSSVPCSSRSGSSSDRGNTIVKAAPRAHVHLEDAARLGLVDTGDDSRFRFAEPRSFRFRCVRDRHRHGPPRRVFTRLDGQLAHKRADELGVIAPHARLGAPDATSGFQPELGSTPIAQRADPRFVRTKLARRHDSPGLGTLPVRSRYKHSRARVIDALAGSSPSTSRIGRVSSSSIATPSESMHAIVRHAHARP